ncbi:hypothetical protein F5B22DRAFT_357320 [Xylaria bambusicola]|uniref:uncharacterized protein n=1 Tax=Xylaria bambusicola TaxID=326684 RepID=UPI002007F9B6|nr:uncharacterized protein F5B22DRAFT_357320 [Xylaria bambusicola]KAI0525720.1 hypothetical protein F5B22DRAFT_357320 [Xylaria bambusicola]
MPSKTPQGSHSAQPTFQDQLGAAAQAARQPSTGSLETSSPSLIEKVAEYVPGVANFVGTGKSNNEQAAPSRHLSGPPTRPHHDDHIADFVRDQHRSKKLDGNLET